MYKVESIDSLTFCDSDGNELFKADGVQNADFVVDLPSASRELSTSFELTDVEFDDELLDKLNQRPCTSFNFDLIGTQPVIQQVKTHKKKRINKKWAKKYGYRLVNVPIEISLNNCQVTYNEEDRTTIVEGIVK